MRANWTADESGRLVARALVSSIAGTVGLIILFGTGVYFWWTGAPQEPFTHYLTRTGPFHLQGIPFLASVALGGAIVGWGVPGARLAHDPRPQSDA
jgi:hypothetical protein